MNMAQTTSKQNNENDQQTNKQKINKLLESDKKQYIFNFEGAQGGAQAPVPSFFSLLTESKKNEVKREIGEAILNILKQTTIKLILKKQSYQRTEKDIDRLT